MVNDNVISQSNIVIEEYKSIASCSDTYQNEATLEKEFIHMLEQQLYEYIDIHKEPDLLKNLRVQLSNLNDYELSDNEWKQLFNNCIAKPNTGIKEKTQIIQEDYIFNLKKDNGETKNIKLIDKDNVHRNKFQIIHQYEQNSRKNRYDVTILVNGFPLVHIELKKRGTSLEEAFKQIKRYKRDSFWQGCGLYDFIQIFVISNGTNTKYYSNTAHNENNSFEFTSFWTDAKNNTIPDLVNFTRTFFNKNTLLSIITKYCVFTSEKKLLVMRPYQIAATERIINKIESANNDKKYGTIEAGGYIWHTTGSGKTLTSFKTAQLVSKLNYIDKVLFVVDRSDLDYQTMKEYDRFKKDSANSNISTKILKSQLEEDDCSIIITTIQKLSIFIKHNNNCSIFDKKVVFIFDECHRSQFGDMHQAIIKHFKKHFIFGFTGTPIFSINSSNSMNLFKTTEQVFGKQLHTYNIVNAIKDKNVLPFKFDDNCGQVRVYNKNEYNAPKRIALITKYILEHFNQKTCRNDNEVSKSKTEEQRKNGFNSIFATSSIEAAKLYYDEFKKQMIKLDDHCKLKIALIYSCNANEYEINGIINEENYDNSDKLDQSSRDFLENAIHDYNKMFHTNFSIKNNNYGLSNYYRDLSLRMKNKEIDLLIVVNMFLTGFDATTLNTLWVDRNLKMHGLMQAFSRTNRL